MPLFRCGVCNCVENTALGSYWRAHHDLWANKKLNGKPLCSECSPDEYDDGSPNRSGGKWHGRFPKRDADEAGFLTGNDGFLYTKEQLAPGGSCENYAPWAKEVLGDD